MTLSSEDHENNDDSSENEVAEDPLVTATAEGEVASVHYERTLTLKVIRKDEDAP